MSSSEAVKKNLKTCIFAGISVNFTTCSSVCCCKKHSLTKLNQKSFCVLMRTATMDLQSQCVYCYIWLCPMVGLANSIQWIKQKHCIFISLCLLLLYILSVLKWYKMSSPSFVYSSVILKSQFAQIRKFSVFYSLFQRHIQCLYQK